MSPQYPRGSVSFSALHLNSFALGGLTLILCLSVIFFAACSNNTPPDRKADAKGPPAGTPHLLHRTLDDENVTVSPEDKLRIQVVSILGADHKQRLDVHDLIKTTFSFGSEEYHILPGDSLAIQFEENSKLDLSVTVRPDGRFTLPGLGEMSAAGVSPLALAKQIDDAYAGRMNRPDASVTVVKSNTAPIDALDAEFTIRADGMVALPELGEVKAAGRTPGELATDLGEIASRVFKNHIAAYVTTRERSTVTENLTGTLTDFDKIVPVSGDGLIILPEVGAIRVKGKTLSQIRNAITDAAARSRGTTLRVLVSIEASEHRVFYVNGEVNKPGSFPLTDGMTTVKALAVAGGPTSEANLRKLVLLHYNEDSSITVYLVSPKAIYANNSAFNDLALSPQDVIYLPKTTIAQVDLFTEQYITKLVPFGTSVSYSYTTFPKTTGY